MRNVNNEKLVSKIIFMGFFMFLPIYIFISGIGIDISLEIRTILSIVFIFANFIALLLSI